MPITDGISRNFTQTFFYPTFQLLDVSAFPLRPAKTAMLSARITPEQATLREAKLRI